MRVMHPTHSFSVVPHQSNYELLGPHSEPHAVNRGELLEDLRTHLAHPAVERDDHRRKFIERLPEFGGDVTLNQLRQLCARSLHDDGDLFHIVLLSEKIPAVRRLRAKFTVPLLSDTR